MTECKHTHSVKLQRQQCNNTHQSDTSLSHYRTRQCRGDFFFYFNRFIFHSLLWEILQHPSGASYTEPCCLQPLISWLEDYLTWFVQKQMPWAWHDWLFLSAIWSEDFCFSTLRITKRLKWTSSFFHSFSDFEDLCRTDAFHWLPLGDTEMYCASTWWHSWFPSGPQTHRASLPEHSSGFKKHLFFFRPKTRGWCHVFNLP